MSSKTEFDNISFDLPKNQSNVIKVIGVGGGGGSDIALGRVGHQVADEADVIGMVPEQHILAAKALGDDAVLHREVAHSRTGGWGGSGSSASDGTPAAP